MEDYKTDFRYINDEIKDRVGESKKNLDDLPELMCSIFNQSETTMNSHKDIFLNEIDDIINK